MAITPNEISNKDFKKGFRGYDMDEVDTFLDAVREDYERVYKSNSNLKEQVIVLKEKVDHYSNMENTLQNTLVLAQTAAQQAKENSQKEANIIVKEAEREAEKIIKDAEKRISEINKEYEFIKQQFNAFKSRFKGMVESQLETIEKIQIEIGMNEAETLVTQEEKAFLGGISSLKEVATDCTTDLPKITSNSDSDQLEVKADKRPDYRKEYKKDYRKDGKKEYNRNKYNQKRNDKVQS